MNSLENIKGNEIPGSQHGNQEDGVTGTPNVNKLRMAGIGERKAESKGGKHSTRRKMSINDARRYTSDR